MPSGNAEHTTVAVGSQHLVEGRRAALEAIAQGLQSLDLLDHLEYFPRVGLAALFCGEQYLDVDTLVKCFKCDEDQEQIAITWQWLKTFDRSSQKLV